MRVRAICCVLVVLFGFAAFSGCKSSTSGSDCNAEKSKCSSVVSGSTSALTESKLDNYKGVSWAMSGPEIIYEVPQNSDEPMVLGIRQKSADFEADYFILRKCDDTGSLIAYGDKEARSCLEPGVYYVVVDGRDAEKGSFEAEIFCAPCDGDGDGDEDGDADGDDPDGDDPDGDDPDGDDPDGDDPDGDEPDGDECIECLTAMDCNWLGDEYVCQHDCCVLVSDEDGDEEGDEDGDEPDGDMDGDADGDSEPTRCGCVCDEETAECSPDPAGTTFTPEESCGWGDEDQCSGFISVYCAEICEGDENPGTCHGECHNAIEDGSMPFEFDDGQTFSAYGCTITINCN